MQKRIRNIFLYGLLNILLYIIAPIIFILILSNFEYFEFNPSFTLIILISGSIGTLISIIKHSFSEDSNAHYIIGIGSTLFSGIYLFYIFGGFSLGTPFGNYQIITESFQAEFGLQIIAWSLLIASLFRTISSGIKFYEKIKNTEIAVRIKRKIRITKITSFIGFLLYILVTSYLIIVAINGSQIFFRVQENYDIGYDDKDTLFDLQDDTINISIYFDVSNRGIFPILDTQIEIEIYTINTTDSTPSIPPMLPNNTKIGESKDNYYSRFGGNLISKNQIITVDIFNEYIPGLISYDCKFKYKILVKNFICRYPNLLLYI